MASIEILTSEAAFLELAFKVKEQKLKQAERLVAEAEAVVDEAIASIVVRAKLDMRSVVGHPRLLRDADGRPAAIVWRDAPAGAEQGGNAEASPVA